MKLEILIVKAIVKLEQRSPQILTPWGSVDPWLGTTELESGALFFNPV